MPYADAITRPQAAPLQGEKVNVSLLGTPKRAAAPTAGVKPTHDFNAKMRARVRGK